jgi:uncharacterized repeat protein (TIGR03803 family)
MVSMKQLAGWLWLACAMAAPAQTAVEHVIHAFANFPKGAVPYGVLTSDSAGNLYGTTYQGGTAFAGAVFKLGASGYRVLYSFKGGADGNGPYAGVALDSAGNLYGTTYQGGAANAGVVYKVSPGGQETVLYSFTGGADGANPYAGVIVDSSGNLYGTTYNGGASKAGVVYKVSPAGQETVLYTFTGGPDGGNPYAGVTADASGNLYGTALAPQPAEGQGGVVYKLDTSGNETVLYTFSSYDHGAASPYGGVILDQAGNLYGTASIGGRKFNGVVYELNTSGVFSALYDFSSIKGPWKPMAGLARDAEGNLYGATQEGGSAGAGAVFELDPAGNLKVLYSIPGGGLSTSSPGPRPNPGVAVDSIGNVYGCTPYEGVAGVVFKVGTAGQESTLYSFAGAASGTYPVSITRDSTGTWYGATNAGGAANAGVVYKVDTDGSETVLYTFTGGADGADPSAGRVVLDPSGNLYGTTFYGGIASDKAGFGVVYEIGASGRRTVLHTFTGGADGGYPGGVILDSAGVLYGAAGGGASGSGVVFRLDPSGKETVLHSFTGGADGGSPSDVMRDAAGNLYGTTYSGGSAGYGVIYKLDPSGAQEVLYNFPGGPDGAAPAAGVVRDSIGNLYGTTTLGGGALYEEGGGVVFKLSAAGQYMVLYAFTGAEDGADPSTGVVRDAAGNLYGADSLGGSASCNLGEGCGVVYELSPSGQLTVLHSFTGGADGTGSGPVVLGAGSIYGPAGGGPSSGGLLYRLTPE